MKKAHVLSSKSKNYIDVKYIEAINALQIQISSLSITVNGLKSIKKIKVRGHGDFHIGFLVFWVLI